MDVAPKGAELKFIGRGSINIALLKELSTNSTSGLFSRKQSADVHANTKAGRERR